MMKSKRGCFELFKEFPIYVEMQSEYEMKAFWWMSEEDYISRDFGVFFKECGIKSMPQNIGPMMCAIQIVVAITMHMLKVQNLENPF